MSVTLAPPMVLQFQNPNNSGAPAAGFQLFTYIAGTSTKQATWMDSSQVTPWSNPIVLDANGAATVWGDPKLVYKFVICSPTDTDPPTTPLRTVDNLQFPLTTSSVATLQFNFPQSPSEVASGVTPVSYSYPPGDIRRYGGDPTGIAPSDAALASALLVAGSTGGTIRLPAGNYLFATPIALNNKVAPIILQGDGGASGGQPPATMMSYSGTASPWINANDSIGIQFKNLELIHTNVAFTGTYIKCSNSGTRDPINCGLFDCLMGSTLSATIHLDLNKCTLFTAERCVFLNGNPSVSLALNQGGGDYCNAIRFRDNLWNGNASGPILGGAQAITFQGCSFEPLASGAPGAIVCANIQQKMLGLVIEGCWIGDAGAIDGTWFNLYGQGLSFKGNWIGGNQTHTTAIKLNSFNAAVIEGNSFNGLLTVINFATAPCNQIVVKGNVPNTVTNLFVNANNVGTGTFDWGANFGASTPPGTNHGSFGTNGYQVTADGIVRQWGYATGLSNGSNTVNFPLAFPTACFNVVGSLSGVVNLTATAFVGVNPTTVHFILTISDATATTDTYFWQAVGN